MASSENCSVSSGLQAVKPAGRPPSHGEQLRAAGTAAVGPNVHRWLFFFSFLPHPFKINTLLSGATRFRSVVPSKRKQIVGFYRLLRMCWQWMCLTLFIYLEDISDGGKLMTPLKCKIVETVESICCSRQASRSPVHKHADNNENTAEQAGITTSSRSSHSQRRYFKIHFPAEPSLPQADSVIQLSEIWILQKKKKKKNERKYVDMWDSFEAGGGIMCKACERRGRACTATDLITARGLLRISRLFWQLKINRAVNEHPQRGRPRFPSPSLVWPGPAQLAPMRCWGGGGSNGFSRHVRAREFFLRAPQNREGKLLSHFLFPGARGWHDWY